MSVDDLTVYERWDLKKPEIPLQSRLFSLKPIGIGTPYCESLSSYLIRLSELHCLSLSVFISRLISPCLRTTFLKNSSSRSLGALFQKARALQGHGDLAKDFVQALEYLTLRKDLSFLTLSVWSNILSHKGLLGNHKVWCPLCYQQQWQSHHVLYEPLLWSLEAVKVCPHHGLRLWENCPHCGNKQPWLTWKSSNGCCSHCHQLLFSPTKTISTHLNQDELGGNIALSESLASLIEIMPILPHNPTQDNLWNNVSAIINGVTQGNISAFAKQLNLPKNTVWGWYHRKSLPPLASLLKISECLDLPLLTLLTEKISQSHLETVSARQLPKQQSLIRQSPRQLNLKLLQQQL
ncbi:TniQ family protein [Cyanothece sp. BG0011]|uniref:TniQ family protein n=1 Tax=Cyanothece sp. BG0011 TaxID=2082950 RepID=UPI000D1D887B|nr:TniQ family protein [Cyanothece sp. BG0011]